MDALVSAALQELAVEGAEGCALIKLWSLIQETAAEVSINLTGRPKQFLWQELLKVPGMVLSLQKSVTISVSDPRVQHVESAEKLGVHVVAPETLRDSSLGLYDLKVCDARISKEQRDILERIAKSRTHGITQSQLSKEFKVTGNKIFYLVKVLESRGLVVRQTTLVRTGKSKTPIVATNLLHLTRYAKDLTLSSHQRFEILKKANDDNTEAGDSVGDDGEGDEVGAKTRGGDYVIQDDLPAMEKICQKLEETEGKVLVVSDLKGSLGYRKAVGHRNWRRLIKRLQDAGVVEVFNAQIDRKVRPCVRLLKSFDVKALNGANEEMETDVPVRREKITEMVMELPIDHQIYDLVEQSGSDGVQMMEVFNRLGLQNKRNYCRVATMLTRHCLVSEAENHKRSTLYRLKTADNASGAAAKTSVHVPCKDSGHASPAAPAFMLRKGSEHASPGAPTLMLCNDSEDAPSQLPASYKTPGLIGYAVHALQVEKSTSILPKIVTEVTQRGETSISSRKPPGFSQDVGRREGGEKKSKELSSLNRDVLASEEDSGSSDHGLDMVTRPSSVSSPLAQVPATRTTQHHSGVQVPTTTRTQREQRILEKLQAEKFILRVELHRWLEDLENRKDTMMDRKTLFRILQAFQRDGRCKCVVLSMPGLTNCGRQRTVQLVLLPSVVVDEEVLNKVHEKVRKFDMDCRGHGQTRVRKKDGVPVLEGVKRMPPSVPRMKHRAMKFDTTADGSWSMQSNGFICAKMVRVSMLHHFLWGYVNSLSDVPQVVDSRQSDGMLGSCRAFALANAVQAMPLELFLQIIGSAHKVEHSAEWCKQGMRICDVPKDSSSLFLDTSATGRLSWLVDVLRRLKLVRLVMGGRAGVQSDQQDLRNCSLSAVLTYAMESEPYLEEPAPSPLPSFGLDNYDTSPRARHEFSIATKDGLDAYWHTLEYFYSGAQPALARHAFPGSSVPELFGLRSWTSLRVMSSEQRHELLKRIGAGGIDKRKSAQECAQIAKDLHLSLYQVLRVSYEKNRIYRLQTLAKTGQGQIRRKRTVISGGFAEPSHVKAYKKLMMEDDETSNKETPLPGVDEDGRVHQEKEEKEGKGEEKEEEEEEEDDEDMEGNQGDFSFVSDLKPSRPTRARRFIWSDRLDRLLIAAYVKQRAKLGAGFPRVDWNTMEQLPAPPSTCRRRMSLFRKDLVVRKAILSLCSLIAARYVKHSESQRAQAGVTKDFTTSSSSFGSDTLLVNQTHLGEGIQSNNPMGDGGQLETEYSGHDYSWDDMREPFLAAALDEIIRCKKVAKASASKRSAPSGTRKARLSRLEATGELDSDAEQLVDGTPGQNIVENCSQNISDSSRSHLTFAMARAMSSLGSSFPCTQADSSRFNAMDAKECTLGDEDTTHLGGAALARFTTAAGPTRNIRKSNPKVLRKPSSVSELSTEQQVRKSVGVANAVEIVKLVLLNSVHEKELVGPLVDAVQRFKEDEVFTAVKYLREQGMLMAGQGSQTFVLSPKFFHDCSASRFPVGTGDQWRRSAQWVSEHSEKMEEDWVSLPAQQQEGQLSHLLTLVSTGEFAFNPSLPAKDIGEVEELTIRRPAAQRPSSIHGEDGRDDRIKNKSWTFERRERGFPGVEVSLMRSNRTLADILTRYSGESTESESIQPETITSSSQVCSPKISEQAGMITLQDEVHIPRMDGEKDSIYTAVGSDSSWKYSESVLIQSLPHHDRVAGDSTRHKQFLDPLASNNLAVGIGAGEASGMTLHQEKRHGMRSDGEDTIAEKSDTDDLVAVSESAADVGDRLQGENVLGPIRSTNGVDVRDILEICKEIPDQRVQKITVNTLENAVISGSPTRVAIPLGQGEVIRTDQSLYAETDVGDRLAPGQKIPAGRHVSTGGCKKSSVLEKCELFLSKRKADDDIDAVKYMSSELLGAAYRAVERAGEEGLALEALQEELRNTGLDLGGYTQLAADCAQVLESFGLVKRVNAFDHVRVLEISHSKRFHLNVVPNNKRSRKRRFGKDTEDIVDKQENNFSSNLIEGAGGFDGWHGVSRRRIDHPGYAAGTSRVGEHRVISLRSDNADDEDDSTIELISIVPWLNRYGAIHPSMLKSLSRRVMGIVAGHPGIPEDMLIEQLKVLNPQSARHLLQLLEADGHLFSRPILQPSFEAPRLLQKVLKEKRSVEYFRYVNHYFSNPMSGVLL